MTVAPDAIQNARYNLMQAVHAAIDAGKEAAVHGNTEPYTGTETAAVLAVRQRVQALVDVITPIADHL